MRKQAIAPKRIPFVYFDQQRLAIGRNSEINAIRMGSSDVILDCIFDYAWVIMRLPVTFIGSDIKNLSISNECPPLGHKINRFAAKHFVIILTASTTHQIMGVIDNPPRQSFPFHRFDKYRPCCGSVRYLINGRFPDSSSEVFIQFIGVVYGCAFNPKVLQSSSDYSDATDDEFLFAVVVLYQFFVFLEEDAFIAHLPQAGEGCKGIGDAGMAGGVGGDEGSHITCSCFRFLSIVSYCKGR